jgi:hypothetical protein
MQCTCVILSSAACPFVQYISTLSHNRQDFRKIFIEHVLCVLIFSTNFVWNISHSKKNRERFVPICMSGFIQSTRYSCSILMILEFSRQTFEKSLTIKFHKNPSRENRVVPCGRTDMTRLIVGFRSCANRPKNDFPMLISVKHTRSVCVLWTVFPLLSLPWTTCLQASSWYCGNVGIVFDFKLSPCSECCMLSCGRFTGVCGLNANVSEHSVYSYVYTSYLLAYEDGTDSVFRNVGI